MQEIQLKQRTEIKGHKKSKKKRKNSTSKVLHGGIEKNVKQSLEAAPQTAEEEEKDVQDAYQALVTEYHKRKAKRKQNPKNQNEQKQADKQNKVKQDEPIQDDFSHLRHKN